MCLAGWMVGGRVQLRREKRLSCRDRTLLKGLEQPCEGLKAAALSLRVLIRIYGWSYSSERHCYTSVLCQCTHSTYN